MRNISVSETHKHRCEEGGPRLARHVPVPVAGHGPAPPQRLQREPEEPRVPGQPEHAVAQVVVAPEHVGHEAPPQQAGELSHTNRVCVEVYSSKLINDLEENIKT